MGTPHNDLLNKNCNLTWEYNSESIWLYPVYMNTKHNVADKRTF